MLSNTLQPFLKHIYVRNIAKKNLNALKIHKIFHIYIYTNCFDIVLSTTMILEFLKLFRPFYRIIESFRLDKTSEIIWSNL